MGLKRRISGMSRNLGRSEFHASGPAYEKARWQNLVRISVGLMYIRWWTVLAMTMSSAV